MYDRWRVKQKKKFKLNRKCYKKHVERIDLQFVVDANSKKSASFQMKW